MDWINCTELAKKHGITSAEAFAKKFLGSRIRYNSGDEGELVGYVFGKDELLRDTKQNHGPANRSDFVFLKNPVGTVWCCGMTLYEIIPVEVQPTPQDRLRAAYQEVADASLRRTMAEKSYDAAKKDMEKSKREYERAADEYDAALSGARSLEYDIRKEA